MFKKIRIVDKYSVGVRQTTEMQELDLEQIYDEHAQALFGYLLNFTRNEADTRDVLQDVFRKLAATPSLLNGADTPRAFLIRLARNAAVDLTRRRSARDRKYERLAEETSQFAPSDNPDEAAFREHLSQSLSELPEDQRSVVHLKLWEKMTFDGIAIALDISPNTAASRYRYGIDKLRTLLRPLYAEINEKDRT